MTILLHCPALLQPSDLQHVTLILRTWNRVNEIVVKIRMSHFLRLSISKQIMNQSIISHTIVTHRAHLPMLQILFHNIAINACMSINCINCIFSIIYDECVMWVTHCCNCIIYGVILYFYYWYNWYRALQPPPWGNLLITTASN